MPSRIRYDNPITANSFEEHIDFSWQIPYTVRIKNFKEQDIVPMHYANTLEILVCNNLTGSVVINNHTYTMSNSNGVFFIAPYVLHSTSIEICEGKQYVIKLDFEKLNDFINIPNVIKYQKLDFNCFSESYDKFDQVFRITKNLVSNDDNFIFCIGELISLINLLSEGADKSKKTDILDGSKHDEKLRKIISWTEEHYNENVSINDVASIACLSRYYFCSYFRKKTNMTYWDYLNHVRIYQACRLLKEGKTVAEVSSCVGFQSLSYFDRLFKEIQGITPKQYSNDIN